MEPSPNKKKKLISRPTVIPVSNINNMMDVIVEEDVEQSPFPYMKNKYQQSGQSPKHSEDDIENRGMNPMECVDESVMNRVWLKRNFDNQPALKYKPVRATSDQNVKFTGMQLVTCQNSSKDDEEKLSSLD